MIPVVAVRLIFVRSCDAVLSNNNSGRKKIGRPEGSGKRGGQTYHGKCDIRLSKEEDSMLSRLAERNGVTRSDVMRRALRDFARFNSEFMEE